jgi:subtilase family serine protease
MDNPSIPHMKTLVDCNNAMAAKGYTESFKIDNEKLISLSDERVYEPEDISIVNFYRFESQSDPGDNSILYVIETNDGKKGTIVNGFGPYSDGDLDKFIDMVEMGSKKSSSELK